MNIAAIGKIRTDKGFRVVLDKKWSQGLTGLAGFSHVLVLWHCDRTPWDDGFLLVPKPYQKAPEQLGVFATRSPIRPSGLAASVVSVSQVDTAKGILELHWIDALDGTPVLDIKPYTPSADRVEKPGLPDWCKHWPKSVETSGSFDWQKEFLFPQ